MDDGAGGMPPLMNLEGLGSVLEDADSISDPVFE
jgi:hypothetical protein